MSRYLSIMAFCVLCCCKTPQAGIAGTAQAPGAASPMSCVIKGKIVSILKEEAGADSVCAKYHCKARVLVVDVISCGSSVSLYFNAGDTLEMVFAYTLSDTKKAVPQLHEHYPGLKEGSVFVANASQRLKPGTGGYFTIYGYTGK